jgi:lipid-A-disaccharide synthase-like uncharacterized protein
MEKTGFLEASPNNKSIMRLAFIMTILVALILTSYLVFTGDSTAAMVVFSAMFVQATGLKLFQNSQENTDKQKETEKLEDNLPTLEIKPTV